MLNEAISRLKITLFVAKDKAKFRKQLLQFFQEMFSEFNHTFVNEPDAIGFKFSV